MWILVGWRVTANSREQILIPTVLENYVADIEVDGKHVELWLYDTGGNKYYKNIRPLSYPCRKNPWSLIMTIM